MNFQMIPSERIGTWNKTEYGGYYTYNDLTDHEVTSLQEYFKLLFPAFIQKDSGNIPNDSYVTLYQIGGNFKKTVKVCDLLENTNGILWNLPRKNLAISQNTFAISFQKNTLWNLFSVNTIVVDIDFLRMGQTMDSVLYHLFDEEFNRTIPVPNILEYGHQMRLIWVLSEPVKLKKEKSAMLHMVETLSRVFANRLAKYGAEYQSPNKYIRLPYSVNTKGQEEVCVETLSSEQWSFQEMIDEFLPDLPEDYERKGWIHRKNQKFKRKLHLDTYNEQRVKDLEIAQKLIDEKETEGHRETLCYLYRNYCLLCQMTEEEALLATLAFNRKFKKPLLEKEVISKTNNLNRKTYIHTAKKILELLGLTEWDALNYQLFSFMPKRAYTKEERKKYNHKYYMEHRDKSVPTRKYQTKRLHKLVVQLKKRFNKLNKKSVHKFNVNARIKDTLDSDYGICVSIKTIEAHITEAIRLNEYNPV